MDKFFKAIGRFFKGIWDWIKSTAWVQPLLIVVIVFAVIFSFSSSSPLMKWIKGLSNTDTTGEFYDQHKKIAFHDLYKDIYSDTPMYQCEVGKRPDGSKAGTALNLEKYDGYTYVLFINSDTNESSFKTFYNNTLSKEEKSHFYVIDFRKDENKKSDFQDTKDGWKAYDDSGAVYYNYLLNNLYEFYISSEYESFNSSFNEKYHYNAKFAEEWTIQSTTKNDAVNDLKFPIICKYKGETLIDFRFCNDFSGNYDGNDAPTVLNNFHEGI